jgi:DNA-binding MarR family transcriptional regulator
VSRGELVGRLDAAGRELSTAAVMFHTALADRRQLGATESKALELLQRLGPLTAGELGEHSGLAPASVTGLVDRLESKGYARRVPHPHDRRRVLVEIDEERFGDVAPLFDHFLGLLHELYERYDDAELAVIADFLTAAAGVQHEATRHLG